MKVVKVKWTDEEIDALIRAEKKYRAYGVKAKWTKIAESVGTGRTGKQCR